MAKGNDPAALARDQSRAVTIRDAAREFLSEHVSVKRKPQTLALYRYVEEQKIVPVLGRRKLGEVTRGDVARLHHSMRATPYMANRVIAVLGALYSWAGRRGLVPDDFNPTRRLEKFREHHRERFLSAEEFVRLGAALREAETVGIPYEIDETRPTAKHAPGRARGGSSCRPARSLPSGC